MRISIALLVSFIVSPLLAGWTAVTPTPRIGPAAYGQFWPAIASNGFDYLVAWTTTLPTGPAVSAVRVNSDGTLATPVAVPLDSNAHSVTVTPGRDGYFAAWISDKGLNVAITDSYGRIEHRVAIPQDGLSAGAQTIAAWNGAVCLVVTGFAGPFVGTLLDNNGDVIQSAIPLGDAHGGLTRVALTVDSGGFLLLSTKTNAWGRDDLYGRRISSSGVAGDWFLVRSMATRVLGLSATSADGRDVIAWGDAFGVWTMSVDLQSNAVSAARQLVPDAAVVTDVIVDSGRTWIAYRTLATGQGSAITIGSDASITAPVSLPSASKLASNGGRILSASAVRGALDSDIVGAFLTPAQADPSFVVSMSETEQRHGTLAGDDSNAVAVWDEAVSGTHQIFAARFGAQALDPSGVQISATGDNVNPDVSFNGQNFLIVWTHGEQTVARRFSSGGAVLDSDDILISDESGYGAPRVAWDGSNWFVVWVQEVPQPACANFGVATRIYGAHVSPKGTVLEPGGVPIDPHASMDQTDVDLVWSGSDYVIAWTNLCLRYHGGPSQSGIGLAAVSPDLTRIRMTTVSTEGSKPNVAATGQHSLVAWTGNGTEFRVIDNIPPQENARRRAVAQPRPFPSVAGSLIAVDAQSIFTRMVIPWAPLYEGIFQTPIGADGSPGTTRFLFVLEPTETLMGRLIQRNGYHWMMESMLNSIFDPAAGAQRLWIRQF